MGDVTAATMLAEMGEDRSRFPTADVLLAETGTAPVTRSSGRSRTVRFRYAANKRMRHAIDWRTFVSVRDNAWAHAAYQQARDRRQPHSRALRGIGARWVRILWRCWTDRTTYDPATHLKNQPEATRICLTPARQAAPSGARHQSRGAASRTPRPGPPPAAACSSTGLTAGVCIVHLLRNSFRYASKRDWGEIQSEGPQARLHRGVRGGRRWTGSPSSPGRGRRATRRSSGSGR